MACVRACFPGLVAAALVLASCGGGSTPTVVPDAPVVASPGPAPSGGGEGASANSCPLGSGDPAAACGSRSPQLTAAVEAALDRLVRERPELFNTQEEAGADTAQYRVLDREKYLDGVVANLRAAGLCAERTVDLERVLVKSTNAFSEEWDVLTASGFMRRGSYSYRQTCEPAVFPLAPADLVAYVRTSFFSFECNPGVVAPLPGEGQLPLGCDGFVTASPKQRNGVNVPAWIHGSDIEWELRSGADVVRVEPDPRFGNPFNKVLRTTGTVGSFTLCATVLGKTGCLDGNTIP
jgi:hypothetical protein